MHTSLFDLDFSFCESTSTGELNDSQGLILRDILCRTIDGSFTLKKKAARAKSLKSSNDARDDKPDNIHQIRRKIEDILLERQQNTLLDL